MFRGSLSGSGQDNAERVYQPDSDDKNPKKYRETFKNNRAQYYWELSRRMNNTYKCVEKGEYIDPDEMISFDSDGIENIQSLRSELCRIPKKPNAQGLIQLMSKDEMKSRLGIDSPNEADAIMMSLFAPVVHEKAKKIKFKGWN